MTAYGKPKTVILDEKESINPIKEILYGFPDNPIEWPHMKRRANLNASYYNVKDDFLKNHLKYNLLKIPGGYYADHERTHMLSPSIKMECEKRGIFEGCFYKEIVIVRENGEKKHYSKWVTIIINF
jgi:hypothetical protein